MFLFQTRTIRIFSDVSAMLPISSQPTPTRVQRIDDVGGVGDQKFGVLVLVGVEHVDDEYRGLAHEVVSTPSPDVDT
jgi:hypothetical protein